MGLLGHSLILILGNNILEYPGTSQWLSLVVIARQPQPGRMVVLIISDVHLINPILLRLLFMLLYRRHDKALNDRLTDIVVEDGLDAHAAGGSR
jgi:hypothetical protein